MSNGPFVAGFNSNWIVPWIFNRPLIYLFHDDDQIESALVLGVSQHDENT